MGRGRRVVNFVVIDILVCIITLHGEDKKLQYNYNTNYGNLLKQTETSENNYLYTGEQYNAPIGMYFLLGRYMNPETGTFTSMDTYVRALNNPISLHKYLYANANPVMYTDPSG